MPRDPQFLNTLVAWLRERAAEQPGRFVFLTLTFDRYRKFAYTVPCPSSFAPTRAEVLGGLALPLPAVDAEAALRKDLDRFCCFMMRAIFGRRYSRRFALQPLAIGALDEPHYKGASKRSAHARRPGDRFDHAHFVMFLPDVRLGMRSVVECFAKLASSGALEAMWRRLNPTGEVHVTDVFELSSAVDYAFKSAKLSGVTTDELLLWPASLPERKSA